MSQSVDEILAGYSDLLMTVFAEAGGDGTTTYLPYNGQPQTVSVTLTRAPPKKLAEVPQSRGVSDLIEVQIPYGGSMGITSVNVGQDKIALSSQFGGTPKPYLVTALMNSTASMWQLQCRPAA